jgi:chitinase
MLDKSCQKLWLQVLLFGSLSTTSLVGAQTASSSLPCPVSCDWSSNDPSAWTYYHSLADLDVCDGIILFQTNIYNEISNARTSLYYRACSASSRSTSANAQIGKRLDTSPQTVRSLLPERPFRRLNRRQYLSTNSSIPSASTLQLNSWSSTEHVDTIAAHSASTELGRYILSAKSNDVVMFARVENVIAGVYVGSQVDRSSASEIMSKFSDQVSRQSPSSSVSAQTCGVSNGTTSSQYFGVIYDTAVNFATVQEALKKWDRAQCLQSEQSRIWDGVSLKMNSGTQVRISPKADTEGEKQRRNRFSSRSTCTYTQGRSKDFTAGIAQTLIFPSPSG